MKPGFGARVLRSEPVAGNQRHARSGHPMRKLSSAQEHEKRGDNTVGGEGPLDNTRNIAIAGDARHLRGNPFARKH